MVPYFPRRRAVTNAAIYRYGATRLGVTRKLTEMIRWSWIDFNTENIKIDKTLHDMRIYHMSICILTDDAYGVGIIMPTG